MSIFIKNRKIVFFILFSILILTGCQYSASQVPTPTDVSTPIPSLTAPSPTAQYQLTYLVTCETDFQCMYAVDVACLESENPCLGQPQLLFKISKSGEGPRLPVLASGWSPDGQMVAIEAVGVSGQGDIYVGDWAGLKWTNLTNSPNYEGDPSWSPDGRIIAFVGKTDDPENYLRAYSITPDGRSVNRLLQLLDPSFPDTQRISWAPDGKQIAFVHSDNQGYNQVYIASSDGSNLKQLTNLAEDHYDPRFSSDGQWIVFTRQPEKGSMVSNLYLIRTDGTVERAVTQENKGWRSESRWSPNGDWIAFTSDIDGIDGIYLIRPGGTDLIKVTHSKVDVFAPAWRTYFP